MTKRATQMQRLVRLLELAASYDDKGSYWRRDSPAQVRQTRQQWQQEIDTLVVALGASTLPAELLTALHSGAAVQDNSGRFVEQARRWMAADQTISMRQPRLITTFLGVAVGVAVTLPAVGAAIVSGGMGHGHYVLARALFPVPLLLTRLTDDTIGLVAGGLALAQFPSYGAIIGSARGGRGTFIVLLVVAVHLLAALACFGGLIPNFS